MIRATSYLRQALGNGTTHGTIGFIPKNQFGQSFKVLKKAPMGNGPLPCPAEMDGLTHKASVILLQSGYGTFFMCFALLGYQRLQVTWRQAEYMKYCNKKELKDTVINYGVYPGLSPQWQLDNAAKAKAKLAAGDDDEDDE